MEASKVILTNETKEKMNMKLSNKKKGELRKQKLIELSKSGKLAMIKGRGELAEAVGYPYAERHKSGYQWVKSKIDSGMLVERITGYTDYGTAEYEYKLADDTKGKFPEPSKEVMEKVNADYEALKQASIAQSMEKLNTYPVLTIYTGDTTIAIENMAEEYIVKAIEAVFKAKKEENNG